MKTALPNCNQLERDMAQTNRTWRLDSLAVVLLACAGLRLTWALSQSLDIGLYDESLYLYGGVAIGEVGLPSSDWGPLYSIWYWLLSGLQRDRVGLYYLNHTLMTVLPALVGYVLLRTYKTAQVVSLILAWLLLVSGINLPTWPKVSHFALILIFLTLIAAKYYESWRTKALCISLGLLFTTYVRPEYFLAFSLSSAIFLSTSLMVLYTDIARRRVYKEVLLHLFSVVCLLTLLGFPLGGDRTIIAFGQHFSYNWVIWNQSDLNPWIDWEYIIAQNFGEIKGLGEAIQRDFNLVLKHITYNLWGFLTNAIERAFPFFLPISKLSKFLIFALSVYLVFSKRELLLREINQHHKLLTFLGAIAIPGLVSILLFFPREHYIFVILSVAWLVLGLLLPKRWSSYGLSTLSSRSPKSLIFVGVLLIALTPNYGQLVNTEKVNLATIRYIQTLEIKQPVNLLDAAGGLSIYAGENFRYVPYSLKKRDFKIFLETQEINFVTVTDDLRNARQFKEDEQWLNFLKNYEDYGYTKRVVPDTEIVLLIESSLLDQS